jgi:hypothetical protein
LSLKFIRVKVWSNVAHIDKYPACIVALPSSLTFPKILRLAQKDKNVDKLHDATLTLLDILYYNY